jgi:hypothetical protein
MSEMLINNERLGEPYVGTKEEFSRILGPILQSMYKNDLFFEGSREDYVDQVLTRNLVAATESDLQTHPRIVALDPAKTQFLAENEVQDILENGMAVTDIHGSEPYVYDSGEKTTVAHEIVARWMTHDPERANFKQPNFLQAPWSTKDPEGRTLAFAAGETAWIMKGKAKDADFIATPGQVAEIRPVLVETLGEGAMHQIERQLRTEPSRAATGLNIGDVLEGSVARRFYLSQLNSREFERRDDVYENYGFEMFPRGDADGGAFVATWAEVEGEMRLQQIRVVDDEAVSIMRQAQDDLQLEVWAACAIGRPVPEAFYEPVNEAALPPLPPDTQIGDYMQGREAVVFYNGHLADEPFHGFSDSAWDQAYELFGFQDAGAIAKWQEVGGEMRLETVTIISGEAREEIKHASGRKREVQTWRDHEIPGVTYDAKYDKHVENMESER